MTGRPFAKIALGGLVAEFPDESRFPAAASSSLFGSSLTQEGCAVSVGPEAAWLLPIVASYHGFSVDDLVSRLIAMEAQNIGLPAMERQRQILEFEAAVHDRGVPAGKPGRPFGPDKREGR